MPSTGQISDFYASPVWEEIESRIMQELRQADVEIERPEPFLHGLAVGKRQALRTVIAYREALKAEAEGKSPYGNRRQK